MKYIVIFLNGFYLFLLYFKNPRPFLGAVILVTLLIGISLRIIFLAIYVFETEPMIMNTSRDFILLCIAFVLLYWFSLKNRNIIESTQIDSSKLQMWVIGILSLFIVAIYIFLANVNRDKILNSSDSRFFEKSNKESLEGKIKKWFK